MEQDNVVKDGCPIEATLSVIGGKWKGSIIFILMVGPIRYNKLKRLLPGVTQRILTKQLRELEMDRVVDRKDYQENPRKVEYSLTEFGESLVPVMDQLAKWGDSFMKLAMQDQSIMTTSSKRVTHMLACAPDK